MNHVVNVAEMSDEQLFAAHVDQGNQDAFTEIHRRHVVPMIDWIAQKYHFERGDAEDIVQITFLRLHMEHAKYDRTKPFRPWLYELCRNKAVHEIERRARIKHGGREVITSLSFENRTHSNNHRGIDPVAKTEELVAFSRDEKGQIETHKHRHAALHEAMFSLSDEDKEIVTLRFYENMTERQTAERLGITRHQLRSRLQAIREQMRVMLANIT